MVTTILKTSLPHISLGRSSPAVSAPASPLPSLDLASGSIPPVDIHAVPDIAQNSKPASSGLAAIAKRSISASGLSRRSSQAERPSTDVGRARSAAPPIDRSGTSTPALPTPVLTSINSFSQASNTGTTGRNLMSLLHPRSSTSNVSSTVPSPSTGSFASTTTIPSQIEASYISKVAMKMHEMVNRIFPAVGGVDPSIVVFKGRCTARADRARDLGDIIYSWVMLFLLRINSSN